MKSKIIMLMSAAVIMLTASCKSNPETQNEQAATTTVSAVDTSSTYICPMKCEGSGSMNPGKCPMCNMDLVLNPDNSNNKSTEVPDSISTESASTDTSAVK